MFERSIDISGQKFGRLTALHQTGTRGRSAVWLFRCDCGMEKELMARNVKCKSHPTASCGCATGFEDLTGRRFDRLEVIERDGSGKFGSARWKCRCDCGKELLLESSKLRDGKQKSCGCLRGESHGMSESPEYQAWGAMIRRCHNPNSPNFKHYGGRGIRVCDEWRGSFTAFLQHVGGRPVPSMSIDRIDPNGHYEPGNVRWASRVEQNNNMRSNVIVEFGGERLTLAQAARKSGIGYALLSGRMRRGMTFEAALCKLKYSRSA